SHCSQAVRAWGAISPAAPHRALERGELVGPEVVGGLAARAEVDGLISAAAAANSADDGGRGTVGEKDVHVVGAARALGLGADAAGVELVGAAVPLVALLTEKAEAATGGG
ncbi:hypothetical protein MUK42_24631, partial [Musa troglodytarum]